MPNAAVYPAPRPPVTFPDSAWSRFSKSAQPPKQAKHKGPEQATARGFAKNSEKIVRNKQRHRPRHDDPTEKPSH